MREWLGLSTREDTTTPPPDGVTPPPRTSAGAVSPRTALTISMVFRAVQVLATSASQLSIGAERNGTAITEPLLLRRPEVGRFRSATIEYLVTSMALTGAAVWRNYQVDPADPASPVTHIETLNPNFVVIRDEPNGTRLYDVVDERGRHFTGLRDWQVSYLPFMRIPGTPYGLGPIQAAQIELGGAIDLRDYASGWFDRSGVASGVLESDQHLNKPQADEYREMWDSVPAGRTRVTGAGLRYRNIMISPRDAQFLESQQFTVTQIARLFGVPSSLMLASVEGNTQTYANVEQDWIGYVRFTLMAYLREIEEAFSAILPARQEARFRVDALLRTDTLTRYQAHEIALRAGWTDVHEVRAIEGMTPRADLPASPGVSGDTPAAAQPEEPR